MQDPASATEAFLCQYHDHWFAIRKVFDSWWNLNSTRKRPAQVGPFYLAAWLSQLQAEGYTIYLAIGDFPAPAQPSADDLHGMENFHAIGDLMERAKKFSGNPVVNEPDSEEEGLPLEVYDQEPQLLAQRSQISLAAARASMREMGFQDPQIDIALQLSGGDGEVASQFLAIMHPLHDPEVESQPAVWAREMQACILGLDLPNASMDMVVQGLLRIGTLLGCPEALQRRAFEEPDLKFDLRVMHDFLRSVLEHHGKADLLSLAALRQRGEAVQDDDPEVIISL